MSKNSSTLPPNWLNVFAIDHCTNEENFTSTLTTKVDRSIKKVRLKINDASVSEGAMPGDKTTSIVPTISEGDPNNNATTISEGDSMLDDSITESNITNVMTSSQTRYGSIAQRRTRSGRISVTPKRLMKASFVGLLSCQIGSNINENTIGSHSMPMFKIKRNTMK